jgi:hypothetical protein
MSRDGKRKYLLKWAKVRCEREGSWGRFKMKWRELNLAMAAHYPNSVTRRWKSFAASTESFPETELAAGLESWNQRITQYREQANEGKLEPKTAKIVETLTQIDLLRESQKTQESLENTAREEREERRRQRKLDVEEKKAEARKTEAEARIEVARQKGEVRGAQKEEEKKEEAPVSLAPVTVIGDGRVDIVRDVAWLYSNLSALIVKTNLGLSTLDLAVLATAPSNGCVTLAGYALADLKGFIERFVIKLLPKDPAESKELGGKQKEEESLDPQLSELTKFLEPKGGEDDKEGGEEDEGDDQNLLAV